MTLARLERLSLLLAERSHAAERFVARPVPRPRFRRAWHAIDLRSNAQRAADAAAHEALLQFRRRRRPLNADVLATLRWLIRQGGDR